MPALPAVSTTHSSSSSGANVFRLERSERVSDTRAMDVLHRAAGAHGDLTVGHGTGVVSDRLADDRRGAGHRVWPSEVADRAVQVAGGGRGTGPTRPAGVQLGEVERRGEDGLAARGGPRPPSPR